MQDQILLSRTQSENVIAMVSSNGDCITAALEVAKALAAVERVEAGDTPGSTYIAETGSENDQQASFYRFNLFLAGADGEELGAVANAVRAHFDTEDVDCSVRVQN